MAAEGDAPPLKGGEFIGEAGDVPYGFHGRLHPTGFFSTKPYKLDARHPTSLFLRSKKRYVANHETQIRYVSMLFFPTPAHGEGDAELLVRQPHGFYFGGSGGIPGFCRAGGCAEVESFRAGGACRYAGQRCQLCKACLTQP